MFNAAYDFWIKNRYIVKVSDSLLNISIGYFKILLMKKKIIPIAIVFILAAALVFFFFSRPHVAFVVDDYLPDDYVKSLSHPSFLSFGYRASVLRESSYRNGGYDLSIILPPAHAEGGIYIGRGERSFSIDEYEMFSFPLLSETQDVFAFVFDENDEMALSVADRIQADYENLILIPYDGRISSVNIEDVKRAAADADRIIVYSPETALRFIEQADQRIYLSWIDAASVAGMKKIIAIAPDWDKAIEEAMRSQDSEIPLHFALSVT